MSNEYKNGLENRIRNMGNWKNIFLHFTCPIDNFENYKSSANYKEPFESLT